MLFFSPQLEELSSSMYPFVFALNTFEISSRLTAAVTFVFLDIVSPVRN